MTTKELAKALGRKLDMPEDLALRAIQETFYIIEETMKNEGKSVTITGFGTFSLARRKERTVVHPVTKERMTLPEAMAPVFKYAQRLKEEFRKLKVE